MQVTIRYVGSMYWQWSSDWYMDHTSLIVQRPPPAPGDNTQEALSDWGFSAEEIAALREAGAVAGA